MPHMPTTRSRRDVTQVKALPAKLVFIALTLPCLGNELTTPPCL